MSLIEKTLNEEPVATEDVLTVATSQQDNMQQNRAVEKQKPTRKLSEFRVEFGPSAKDILNFTNQIAVMVRAGITIQDSLDAIAGQVVNRKFQVIIVDIKDRIEAGESFSQALSKHPKVFSNLYVNMIGAAEMSGSLSEMLDKLAGYLDSEAETRSQVIGAMVYPAIIAFMAVSCTTFLLTFVLPKFTAIFVGKEHLLPKPTIIIMAISAIVRGYWYLLLPGIIATFWGLYMYVNTKTGRVVWDTAKLKIPLMRTLCRSLYITRSLHTMGVLLNAGVPILDTLAITAEISGNVLYKRMWNGVYESVRQGKKIANSLDNYTLMGSSVVQMIRSGEDSGSLSDVLTDVSEFYRRQLKSVIKMVTSMIEPIMIVLMGFLVGFIAMSVILPIFKMSSIASGK